MASPAAFIHGADGTVLRDILISGLVSRAAWKWWQSNNEGSAAESTAASLSEAKATATDTATDTDDATEKRCTEALPLVLPLDHPAIPAWLTEDERLTGSPLLSGYRRPTSACGCFCSCGCAHNETFNIWSHWVAALWFARNYARTRGSTRYVAAAAAALFTVSASAHTLSSKVGTISAVSPVSLCAYSHSLCDCDCVTVCACGCLCLRLCLFCHLPLPLRI